MDKFTIPKTLDELVAQLHDIFDADEVNIELVKYLMGGYKSNPDDWEKFCFFDQHRYTRNLVDSGNGKFNLMILCWGEGQGSSIHSHANSHCFLKILKGAAQETRYAWPDSESENNAQMTKISEGTLTLNECGYMSDEIGLHRIENPSHSDTTVSLHLYSPPFDECYCFDERNGSRKTSKVTFWSQYGDRTPFTVVSNAGDCE